MSDLFRFDDEAKVVHYDDRPVEIVLAGGESLHLRMGDLLDDQFDAMNIAVVCFSPDEEYADFVPSEQDSDDD